MQSRAVARNYSRCRHAFGQRAGAMFWLSRNTFSGLYWLLSAASRAYVAGQLDDAERYVAQHFTLARRMGDLRSVAQAHDDLAVVALVRQDLDRAAVILKNRSACPWRSGRRSSWPTV